MTKTTTCIPGQMTLEDIRLPEWEHPEHGTYYIRDADAPHSDFEILYFDMLTKLVQRKWEALFMGRPYPEMRRIEIVDERDLAGDSPFAPVQGIRVKFPKKPWNAMFIKPARFEASLDKNRVAWLKLGEGEYALSPFFEWELADFWEGGVYELD